AVMALHYAPRSARRARAYAPARRVALEPVAPRPRGSAAVRLLPRHGLSSRAARPGTPGRTPPDSASTPRANVTGVAKMRPGSGIEAEREPTRGAELVVLGARRRRVVVLVRARDPEREPLEQREIERGLGPRQVIVGPVTHGGQILRPRAPERAIGQHRIGLGAECDRPEFLAAARAVVPERDELVAEVVLVDPGDADVRGEVPRLALDEAVAGAAARLG